MSEWLSAVPCAFFDLGSLEADGRNVPDPLTQAVLWSAGGAELGLMASPSEALFVSLGAGVMFPFTRNRFYFDPDDSPEATVHEVPSVGLLGAISVGLQFF
jgi:hypothetical protein